MNRQYGALSGVAIVLIVLNHAIHFGLQTAPVSGGWLKVLVFLQALGGYAVPIFLFISGAFLAYAAGELSFRFVKSNVGRILWPYAIWSAVFYAVVSLMGGEREAVLGYFKNLLVGYPYHFVPLLVFWYLSAPLLSRFGRVHGAVLLAVILLYQVVLLALRFPDVLGFIEPFPRWSDLLKPPVLFTSMANWAVYFPLGLVLSMHDRTLKPRLLRIRWVLVSVAAMVFLTGILNAFGLVTAPWARFAAPLPVMLLLPTIDRGSIPFVRRFEQLGKRTYGIYLAHFVLINLAVFAFKTWAPALAQLPWLVYPAYFVVALGGSLLLMDSTSRPLPFRSVYRYVFGVIPPVPGVRRPPSAATGFLSGSGLPHRQGPSRAD